MERYKIETWSYDKATPPRKELVIVDTERQTVAVKVPCDFTGDNPYTIPHDEAQANAATICAALNGEHAAENERLREAVQANVAWFDAENDHSYTSFQDRMDMCSYSEWISRKALGLPCKEEWEGVPQIVLNINR